MCYIGVNLKARMINSTGRPLLGGCPFRRNLGHSCLARDVKQLIMQGLLLGDSVNRGYPHGSSLVSKMTRSSRRRHH